MSLAANNDAVRKSITHPDTSGFRPPWNNEALSCLGNSVKVEEEAALCFNISHSQTKEALKGTYYTSPCFTVGSNSWYFHYYPNGQCFSAGECESIGLYLHTHVQSDTTFVTYGCALVDKEMEVKSHKLGISSLLGAKGCGWHEFATKADVESTCVEGDDVKIMCFLTCFKLNAEEESATRTTFSIPPRAVSSLVDNLLENKDTADTKFAVDGETVFAHRLVLATQSPVFKAMLDGQMSEGESAPIEISDMKASVFKAMVHYMYTDSLPKETTLGSESNLAAQHLLEAADRYGLDRLKLICEDMLCECITIDTVATSLAFSHQHNCHKLKDACLNFLADPEIAQEVMVTSGYVQLIQSCPGVMMDLGERINLRKRQKVLHGRTI